MAGEGIITDGEYPDQRRTSSFIIDLASSVQKQVLAHHDKRWVIDAISVVTMDTGATSTLRFYATPLGQDVQGTPGDANHPYITNAIDCDAITGATSTATAQADCTIVTTENKLAEGTQLCVEKTGTPAGKTATVVVRWRERLS